MAERKNLANRLAPLLARYNGDTPLFGTQVKKALEVIKAAWNGKHEAMDEPGTRR